MSGGSYNYLCFHTDNLTEHLGDLEEMSKRLDGLPWASEAAADTRRLRADYEVERRRVDEQARLIADVLRTLANTTGAGQ